MDKLFAAIWIFFLFCPNSFAEEKCEHSQTAFHCVKYVKNYDADTITVEIQNVHPLLGKNISVRVAHLDTPEIKTHNACEKSAGRAAQKLVQNVLKSAKRIDLENVKRDKYFRILADVFFDGKNIRDLLFKNNLAYAYEGGTKQKIDWCKRLQVEKK